MLPHSIDSLPCAVIGTWRCKRSSRSHVARGGVGTMRAPHGMSRLRTRAIDIAVTGSSPSRDLPIDCGRIHLLPKVLDAASRFNRHGPTRRCASRRTARGDSAVRLDLDTAASKLTAHVKKIELVGGRLISIGCGMLEVLHELRGFDLQILLMMTVENIRAFLAGKPINVLT